MTGPRATLLRTGTDCDRVSHDDSNAVAAHSGAVTERWTERASWLTIVLAVALTACGTSDTLTDRAGNPRPTVTVSLAMEEGPGTTDGLLVSQFADEVARRSDGRVEVDVTHDAGGGGVAWDQKVIERVADGDFDLVLARAGAWHTSGVTSLDVLQLPGLVDTDEQAERLASDHAVVDQLLAGLDPVGFTGLGLYPEAPRYLMLLDGSERFDTDALRGRAIRAPRSETVFDVLRAAGMNPVDLSFGEFPVEVTEGNVTSTEAQLARVELTPTIDGRSNPVVAANLPLYTKFLVLAARSGAVDDNTLSVLRESARAIIEPFATLRTREVDSVEAACQAGGQLVDVAADDRAAFLAAVQPVIDAFEAGVDGALLRLVRVSAGSASDTSWTCGQGSNTDATALGQVAGLPLELPAKRSDIVPTPGDLPDGVYRFTETEESLAATNAPPDDEPFIGEFVLSGGMAELHYFELDGSPQAGEPPDDGGVYQVEGDLMVFATPPQRAIPGTTGIYLLRWSLDGDTLTLTQIDDRRRDADFAVPWLRVGDAP